MATRNERKHASRHAPAMAASLALLILACLPGSNAAAQEAAPAPSVNGSSPAPQASGPPPAEGQASRAGPDAATLPQDGAPAQPVPAAGTVPQPEETPASVGDAPPASVPPAAEAEEIEPPASGVQIAHNLPSNLSPWGMFLAADIVVKAVMVGLAFASLVTWTVWLSKSLELGRARLLASRGLAALGRSATLGDAARELDGRSGAVAALVQAAGDEVALSAGALDHAGGHGLKERVSSRLARVEAGAARRMTRGTGLLATIGSTAPFVGLFGTVWGIMNSFIGISESQTTNLAIVAPGIAEALLATAIGLVAAIPAVVIYNLFARATAAYRQILGDASASVERLVSRDLDFRAVPPQARRMAAE